MDKIDMISMIITLGVLVIAACIVGVIYVLYVWIGAEYTALIVGVVSVLLYGYFKNKF